MRIGKVIGTVTLSREHPTVSGGRFKLTVPLSLEDLASKTDSFAESLVVYDELGADEGSHIALAEGREAAQPFHPQEKPIDAYNAAILDRIDVDRDVMPRSSD